MLPEPMIAAPSFMGPSRRSAPRSPRSPRSTAACGPRRAPGTSGTSEPESTISPAASTMPSSPSVLASQVTQRSGEPIAAAPVPRADDLAVLLEPPCRSRGGRRVAGGRASSLSTNMPRRGVVGDRVLDADLPVVDARVDDLEAGLHALGRREHVGRREPGPAEIALRARRRSRPRRAAGSGVRSAPRRRRRSEHLRSQVAEVGLVDAEHVLHDLARHADLLADVLDALALELAVRRWRAGCGRRRRR